MSWGGLPMPVPPRAPTVGRRSHRALIGVFAGVLAVAVGIALLGVLAGQPSPPRPQCPPGDVNCGNPPIGQGLVTGKVWRSPDLGYLFEYDPNLWQVVQEDRTSVKLLLKSTRVLAVIWVEGERAPAATPQQLVDRRLSALGQDVLGLGPVAPRDRILGPNVGYVDGPGGAFAGTLDTPQGPSSPVSVAVMAATDDQVSAVVSIVVDTPVKEPAFHLADSVFNTFLFPSEIA